MPTHYMIYKRDNDQWMVFETTQGSANVAETVCAVRRGACGGQEGKRWAYRVTAGQAEQVRRSAKLRQSKGFPFLVMKKIAEKPEKRPRNVVTEMPDGSLLITKAPRNIRPTKNRK